MTAPAARIGLFGGTFDPVHIGHLRCALELRDALGLDEVRLVPNRRPVHRGPTGAAAAHRLAMLSAACAGVAGLAVDARELERDAPSYTVDTLEAVARERPGTTLVFCLGLDAFNDLPDWHRPKRILEIANLAIIDRPGAAVSPAAEALLAAHRGRIVEGRGGAIERHAVTQLAISATRIRRDVAAGRDVRFLITDATSAYIRAHGLYRGPVAPIVQR